VKRREKEEEERERPFFETESIVDEKRDAHGRTEF